MRIPRWVLRSLWIGGRSGNVFHVKLAQVSNRLIGSKFCTAATCAKLTQYWRRPGGYVEKISRISHARKRGRACKRANGKPE